MKILILGATSSIGKSISKGFAKNNQLFLLSTKIAELKSLKKEVIHLGAIDTKIISLNLGHHLNINKFIDDPVDMIINIASATSRLKNSEINPHHNQLYTSVDLSNPLIFLEHFLEKGVKKDKDYQLYYIFINTILSKIQSPDYSIYYSYKILQQEYMRIFQRKYNNNLKTINAIVGKTIDKSIENKKTINLVNRIHLAIKKDESEFIFGFEGKLINTLYSISPLLSNTIIYLKRFLLK